jgi:hypothetical protein
VLVVRTTIPPSGPVTLIVNAGLIGIAATLLGGLLLILF